jgi:hypothetical protein
MSSEEKINSRFLFWAGAATVVVFCLLLFYGATHHGRLLIDDTKRQVTIPYRD